jgi:phosphate starvation-inducible protein PhoH
MTSAAVEIPSTHNGLTGVPEVESALARRHDADAKRLDALHRAYLEAVNLAALREPIPDDVADRAVDAAHQLGFRPGRMDTDVNLVRQLNTVEQQESEWLSTSDARKQRTAEIRLELEAARRLIRELEAEAHRLGTGGYVLVSCAHERRRMQTEAPHLFKPASELTDAEWRHVRAGS